MSETETLLELLLRYEEARERGESPPLEDVCADHPELVEVVRQRLQDLGRLHERFLGNSTVPDAEPPVTMTPAGPLVAGHELLEELGQGGMGIVYKARQPGLNRLVALKLLRGGAVSSLAQLARFRLEAEAIARLRHPNIVRVIQVGEHQGQPFLTLEFCPGGSLADRLRTEGPFDPRAAADCVRQVADAIQHAHDQGIVHRDLKPANVLRDEQGIPRVTDFGLAKDLGDNLRSLTGDAVMGTPAYMAPEQAAGRNREVGPLADVWALGGILYALLTGRPPFKAPSQQEILQQVLTRDPVSPRTLRREVPRDLETICLKCLQKDPDRRYASAQALADELSCFLEGRPITARPVGRAERTWRWCRRNPAAASAALLGVVLLAAAVVVPWLVVARERENAANLETANRVAGVNLDAAREALSNAAVMARTQATHFCEQDDIARGLLWHARALRFAPESAATLRESVGLHLAGWARGPVQLRDVCKLPGAVLEIVVAPAGGTFATRARTGPTKDAPAEARLWNLATGKAVAGPLPHPEGVLHLAYLPDGAALFTLGADGVLRRWGADGRPQGQVVVPSSHGSACGRITVAPDGKTLVTAGPAGGTAWVWDVQPLRPRAELKADPGPVPEIKRQNQVIVYSPDSSTILGDTANGVQFWAAATGRPKGPTWGTGSLIWSAAFSPDGKTVAIGAYVGATIWDVAAGKAKPGKLTASNVPTAFEPVTFLAFTAEGDRIVARHPAGFDFVDPKASPVAYLPLEAIRPPSRFTAVAWSPGARLLLTGGDDGVARVWDGHTSTLVSANLRHDGQVLAAAFSPDASTLLTGGEDGQVLVWTLHKPSPQRGLRLDTKTLSAGFSADGSRVWARQVGMDFTMLERISLFDAATGAPVRAPALPPFSFEAARYQALGGKLLPDEQPRSPSLLSVLGFDPDLRLFACTRGSVVLNANEVLLWDASGPEPRFIPIPGAGFARKGAVAPDRKVAAINAWDKPRGVFSQEARLIDTATGKTFGKPLRTETAIDRITFSPDGAAVLTSHGRNCRLWDARTGEARGGTIPASQSWAFSADGKCLLAAAPGALRRWDVATGRPLDVVLRLGTAEVVQAIRGDLAAVIVVTNRRSARLVDLATGQPLTPVLHHDADVTAAAVHGRTVATGDSAGYLRIWDDVTGKPLMPPVAHGPAILGIAFSPDGSRCVTASGGGARLVELPRPVFLDGLRAERWAQVLTRSELDEAGVLRPLDAEKWQRYRREFEELGGPPGPGR